MRDIIGYMANQNDDGTVTFARQKNGVKEDYTTDDFRDAVIWLSARPAGTSAVFTVCYSLSDFSTPLFSLLPDAVRHDIEHESDKVIHEGVKIFYVNERYLGLSVRVPMSGNIYYPQEINIQALKWWVAEEDEPADLNGLCQLGERIVKVLDDMKFHPLKLTSPVAVFTDCFLGDARKYPTVYNFDEKKFGAVVYAEKMASYEWREAYQLGYFERTHLYDLTSAYPAVIRRLPDTTNCRCEYATKRPEWSTFGLVKGEITVQADIHPYIHETRETVRGTWEGIFTTREIEWLYQHDAGTFKLIDGWFFYFPENRPYKEAIDWLWMKKNSEDKFVSTIAKRMANGISGKLDETYQDGNIGDYYNPILAAIVRSENRLAVAEFIYSNNLVNDVIAITVDSVLSEKYVNVPDDKGIGKWRYEGAQPAIVLSKGSVWRPGKRPNGIAYEDLEGELRKYPDKSYYEFRTAGGNRRSIDLMFESRTGDTDRRIQTGGDLMNGHYRKIIQEVEC